MSAFVALLIALSVVMSPVSQAPAEITITVETMDAPGGCVISLDGYEGWGTIHGFTGLSVGENFMASQYFSDAFDNSTMFYSAQWGWMTFDSIIILAYCNRDGTNDDFGLYVYGTEIISAELLMGGEVQPLDVMWHPEGPNLPTPPEFGLFNVKGWHVVHSPAFSHKKITITVSQ